MTFVHLFTLWLLLAYNSNLLTLPLMFSCQNNMHGADFNVNTVRKAELN